jgi:hypothetical protein
MQFDSDIGGDSEINNVIHDPSLWMPAFQPLYDALTDLALVGLGLKVPG